MMRSLWTAASGMKSQQTSLDTISNNLANINTTGYKKERTEFQSLLYQTIQEKTTDHEGNPKPIGAQVGLGVKVSAVSTEFEQGELTASTGDFDFAIQGNGFFAIKVVDKNGDSSIKYTRNGQFTITNEGYVVDVDGNRLQGANGDVQVPVDATDVAIKLNGAVYANGEQVDTITLTDFEDYNYLDLYGDNMYNAVDGATTKSSTATILQGFTEQSNVNVVDEMVSMITITRAYEAGQKMIKTQDSLLEQAVSSVGKV